MNKYLTLILISVALGLASCDSTTAPTNGNPVSAKGTRLFVLNQGGYGHNNASLDMFNWKDSSFASDLIDPLGDVGNDIELINGRLYVALDNSAKLVSVNPDSTADHTTINLGVGHSPGRIVQISSTEALIADLYSPTMDVLNLTTNKLAGSIHIGSGQTWLAMLGSTVYSIGSDSQIVAIDPSTKTVTKSHYIGEIPMQIFADAARSKLLVYSAGGWAPLTPSKLLWVDPTTFTVTDSLVLDTTHFYSQLVMAGNKAYMLCESGAIGVNLITHQFLPGFALPKSYYGGYYDAVDGLLYLGAGDFTSPGEVDVYDASTLTLKKSFAVGIAPAFFAIVR